MDVYAVVTVVFLGFAVLWAAALMLLWATRPVAHPMLFVRALACVGAVTVCALAGMSTFSEANPDTRMWRILFAGAGVAAAVAGGHQTYRLMTEREFDLRGPGMRGRKR